MQDRPTARELLTDIADLLETQVVPAFTGPLQHQVRVAGNLCRIIERELAMGAESERREVELLDELLGVGSDDALELNRLMVERLRKDGDDGDVEFEKAAWHSLVEI